MSRIGKKNPVWDKELDDKLLSQVSAEKSYEEICQVMDMCKSTILKRLKQMGFDGLVDARRVLTD